MQLSNVHPILISGPTASGKSELALRLAEKSGACIVNADALQVYQGYQILTARPSADDCARAPHLLYGHIPNDQPYSVGDWLREVETIIRKETRPLIIIGGTGLYFRAITEGLIEIPPIAPEIRQELEAEYEISGKAQLIEKLEKRDPTTFSKIDKNNPRRIIRALEVYYGTGKAISEWQSETPAPLIPLENALPVVILPRKEVSTKRLTKRFEGMVHAGALDEVRAQMHPWNPQAPQNKAIGANELAAYLNAESTLEEAIQRAVISTRQYAKRQRSWIRTRMKNWLHFESTEAAISSMNI